MKHDLIPLHGKKWNQKTFPKRILVIRLQAFGDVVITLPYLQNLRNKLPPETEIDFLTRTRMCEIPKGLSMFRKVYIVKGGNNVKKEFFWFLTLLPELSLRNYDAIIDLQNHRFSKIIRRLLYPKAWVEFDRASPVYAGFRTKRTIDFIGIKEVEFSFPLDLKSEYRLEFSKFGLPNDSDYVVINPAGFFKTRNWPMENYIAFCKKWIQFEKRKTLFLFLGESRLENKASYFQKELGERFLDLVGKTSALEALQILAHSLLVVSEDSGLFHMACTTGVPTLGIYGSTRNDWTNPMLPHTFCFNSSDLECGDCMRENCLFSTVKCLTRVTAESVYTKAIELIETKDKQHEA